MILGLILLVIVIMVSVVMTTCAYITIFGGGPFVPTPMPAVQEVLKHANIKKGQKVYDIGAGDGRFIHFASKKYGADATGFEIDPFVFLIAKIRQWFWKWEGKMIRADFRSHSLKDADCIVCYMLPRTLAKFQKKFDAELKKGAKVVSYAFHVGDWKPKKIIPKKITPKKGKIAPIYIYQK